MSFDWTPTTTSERSSLIREVQPSDVLYSIDDEAVLFVSASEQFSLLCFKLDADAGLSQYLVVPTNRGIVSGLRRGKTSLRAALAQPWAWIVEATDDAFAVKRSWKIGLDAVPDNLLPKEGSGLHYRHGFIPDRVNSPSDAYLSVKFRGGDIKNGTIPFGVIKGAVEEVYSSLWRIFSPAVQSAAKNVKEATLRRVVNIPTYEFAHASLLIAIEKPEIDLAGVKHKAEVDVDLAVKNIDQAHDAFLKSINVIATAVDRGRVRQGLASDHFDAIEAVAQLIPNQNSFFEAVEINGRSARKTDRSLVLNVQYGRLIRDIYQTALTSARTITGEIFLVNSQSNTFSIRTGYKEVTCVATSDSQRQHIPLLRNGDQVSVKGRVQRRKRRDLLDIQEFTVDGDTIS